MAVAPFRRSRTPLDAYEVARLVAMRDRGATWKDIGRAFAKQDGACKSIYDRAKERRAPDRDPRFNP